MLRKISLASFMMVILFLFAVAAQASDKGQIHKLAIQVSDNSKQKMNIALNNATNVIKHYGIGNVEVEIVAYGPGLDLFIADPQNDHFAKRLASLHAFGNVKYGVCQNTMAKRKIKKENLVQAAFVTESIVPSGVVRLMELQDDGYNYIRP